MKIKICGLFREEDVDYVNETMPDFAGFVFAESRRKISPEKAYQFRQKIDRRIKTVGVFVDSTVDFVTELVRNGTIDVVQLHGSENEEYVRKLREKTGNVPIIKAFSVSCRSDIEKAAEFPCDYMLLDNGKGGTGKSFAWELLDGNMPENVFLAGGVNTDNISDAIKLKPYCIDVSSGAETDGIKDRKKIDMLVQAVHGCHD
jgi:phosphoribosylanthranilate isomerase